MQSHHAISQKNCLFLQLDFGTTTSRYNHLIENLLGHFFLHSDSIQTQGRQKTRANCLS
uniref:Uncharacterized protein n=1 Tax=Rhizophora mucronata TaxID=61149 RepID=A0A2P2LG26_RHIMU